MKFVIWFVLCAQLVFANVVINQVLYDPVGTESGGEAVELKNDGSSPVDISGWVLATESSETDVTIPDNTILLPGQTFLIADSGWDANKDNPDWKSADYEETMTLGNRDSGAALLSNGSVVDAVGWGDEAGIENSLYEGSPAVSVGAGMALLRVKDTDDNSADFVESPADFEDGIPVAVTANITLSVPVIEISKSLNIVPEGVLSVKNNGASAVNIKLIFNDLYYKNNTIPKSAIETDELEFVVQPGEEHESIVRLRIPGNSIPGTYTSTLRVVIDQIS